MSSFHSWWNYTHLKLSKGIDNDLKSSRASVEAHVRSRSAEHSFTYCGEGPKQCWCGRWNLQMQRTPVHEFAHSWTRCFGAHEIWCEWALTCPRNTASDNTQLFVEICQYATSRNCRSIRHQFAHRKIGKLCRLACKTDIKRILSYSYTPMYCFKNMREPSWSAQLETNTFVMRVCPHLYNKIWKENFSLMRRLTPYIRKSETGQKGINRKMKRSWPLFAWRKCATLLGCAENSFSLQLCQRIKRNWKHHRLNKCWRKFCRRAYSLLVSSCLLTQDMCSQYIFASAVWDLSRQQAKALHLTVQPSTNGKQTQCPASL